MYFIFCVPILNLYRMTTAFVDFNGVVPEKFDAVKLSHLVDAEYGNQGIDFKMVPPRRVRVDEWCVPPETLACCPCLLINVRLCAAAYQVGLSYLSTGMRRAVSACTSPEVFFGSTAVPQPISNQSYSHISTTDPLNLAMETLNLGEPIIGSPISPAY